MKAQSFHSLFLASCSCSFSIKKFMSKSTATIHPCTSHFVFLEIKVLGDEDKGWAVQISACKKAGEGRSWRGHACVGGVNVGNGNCGSCGCQRTKWNPNRGPFCARHPNTGPRPWESSKIADDSLRLRLLGPASTAPKVCKMTSMKQISKETLLKAR